MAEFVVGKAISTKESSIEVTVDPQKPIPSGKHIFTLTVKDDSGNVSKPATVQVIIRDSKLPTAVITAPLQVEYGQSFSLVGEESSDVAPGQIVNYIWTMVQ